MSFPSFFLFLLLGTPSFAANGKSRAKALSAAFCPFQQKAAMALVDHSMLHDSSIAEISDEFKAREKQYGRCKCVREGKNGKFEFLYEEAQYELGIDWGENEKVLATENGRPKILDDSFERIASSLERLFPGSSFYVSKEDKEIFGYEADRALNVSYSSQLFLLSALERQIKEKKLSGNRVVELSPNVKATAIGLLHYWEKGSSVTIDTLRNLIIAEGDLSAADLLLETLGQESVEREGKRLSPFLSNRKFSILMRELPPKKPESSTEIVQAPDQHSRLVGSVGWFASTRELCRAFFQVKERQSLYETASALHEKDQLQIPLDQLAIKDVAANGVRQTTMLLKKNSSGPWTCFSLTSNQNDLIDEQQFDDLKYRIVRVISKK